MGRRDEHDGLNVTGTLLCGPEVTVTDRRLKT